MIESNTHGFIEIDSSLNQTVGWHFRKNVDYVASYRAFLHTIESELITKSQECVRICPINYNLRLKATCVVPNSDDSTQNRAFKTSARQATVCVQQRRWFNRSRFNQTHRREKRRIRHIVYN